MSLRALLVAAVLAAPPPALAGPADTAGPEDVPPRPARRAALASLVRQDCGSCHGMTLKGGLGPPLTPQAVSAKPPEMLAYTILLGRPGTPMPPWREFVSAPEAAWIVETLRRGDLDAH